MKIKSIKIENFRNIQSLNAEFGDKTVISGKNKTGKSTIRDAILWCLYDKLADGSSANNIRPKDANGTDIDFLEIKVCLVIEHDGHEYVLEKLQKQKWTKKRGSEEKKFEGNVNEFSINDIPKKLKDYQEFISEICDPDTMLFGTNAQSFLGMDTKKRRAKLLSLEPDFSDADVIALDDDFKEIEDDLFVGTIDELIARAKKVKKQKNDDLKTIPVRIDEVSKQKVEVDVASLEKAKSEAEAELKSVQNKFEELANKVSEKRELESQIMELKFEQAKVEKEYNSANQKRREEVNRQIDDKKSALTAQKTDIRILEGQIAADKTLLEKIDFDGKALNKEYANIAKDHFKADGEVCPICGRKMPKEHIQKAEIAFEESKAKTLKVISEKGKNLKMQKQATEDMIAKNSKEIDETKTSVDVLTTEIMKLESKLKTIPADAEPTSIKEWNELQKSIDARQEILNQPMPYDKYELDHKETEIRNKIAELDRDLSAVEQNKAIDARIEELKIEQRDTAQAVADAERQLDILERFNKAKIELLTDKVNQHFQMVKWQMFEPQINGGYQAVCNPTVNGISYFSGLNHGDRLLADMDICKAWQDASGIKLPIFLDDAESVDADRIPEYDRQLIVLRRTDDDKLTIK